MKKMEAADVRERIEARRLDSEQLEQQISKLQRRIDDNDDDIITLQDRCPHKWGEWSKFNVNITIEDGISGKIVQSPMRMCDNCKAYQYKDGKKLKLI